MLSKKLFAFSLLVLTFSAFGMISVSAQNLYKQPARLFLKGDETEDPNKPVPIREHFYPIGWSRDGKFAYLLEPPDEECGCYFAYIAIQDMRNDKVLWEKKYDSQDGGPENLKAFWKANQKEFSAQLAKHKIVAQPRFALQKSVFNYQKDSFTPAFRDNSKTEDSMYISGDVELSLTSKQKGKKTIFERKFNPEEIAGFLGADIAGSLISPYESRAVVLLVEMYRGWEGPPHVTSVRVVGADLEKGFR